MRVDYLIGAMLGILGMGIAWFIVSLSQTPNFWTIQGTMFLVVGLPVLIKYLRELISHD